VRFEGSSDYSIANKPGGLVEVLGGTLSVYSLRQSGGRTRVGPGAMLAGMLSISDGVFELVGNGQAGTLTMDGGVLEGTGSASWVANNGAIVCPGSPLGLLTANTYQTSSSGLLRIEIGGPNPGEFDRLFYICRRTPRPERCCHQGQRLYGRSETDRSRYPIYSASTRLRV